MYSGRLRNLINILQPTEAQDSTGGTSLDNNTVFATVWASVEAITGTEQFAAASFVSTVTHQVVIRWLDCVTSAMQVQFGSRRFQIEAVLNPDERSKMLVLLCTEVNDSRQQVVS